MLVAFDSEDLSHLSKLLLQPSNNILNVQPPAHHIPKIHPEGVSHPTRLVTLPDGPVVILTGCATLRVKSFLSPT